MFNPEIITIVVSGIVSILTGTSVAVFMRSKYKAEVAKARAEAMKAMEEAESASIENSDKLVELYKKIYTDLAQKLKSDNTEVLALLSDIKDENKELKRTIELLSNENTQLTKVIRRLERAIKNINNCPRSGDCPILAELQNSKSSVRPRTERKKQAVRQHSPVAEIDCETDSNPGIQSNNQDTVS